MHGIMLLSNESGVNRKIRKLCEQGCPALLWRSFLWPGPPSVLHGFPANPSQNPAIRRTDLAPWTKPRAPGNAGRDLSFASAGMPRHLGLWSHVTLIHHEAMFLFPNTSTISSQHGRAGSWSTLAPWRQGRRGVSASRGPTSPRSLAVLAAAITWSHGRRAKLAA